jgi:Ser/Thr protein kinase RdoA (MazF antagonist)
MTDDQAHAVAAKVLAEWGGARHPPRLIANRENAVFEVVLNDARHVALRLHRPGYQADTAIRSELTWMSLLAKAGFRCCWPVPTVSGALLAHSGGRAVSAVHWLDGAPIGAAGVALNGSAAQQVALFRAIGRMIAGLHAATDVLKLPGDFQRPHWDEDGLLGAAPLWGRFWENPSLEPGERDLLLAAREKAQAALAGFRRVGADFGLIHADILRENVLKDEAGLALIDFDDCGFGFRMLDLGAAMSQNLDEPNAPALSEALIAGYRDIRNLPEHAAHLMGLFVALRAFASCGWIIARAPADDPRQRQYAKRALRCARDLLQA